MRDKGGRRERPKERRKGNKEIRKYHQKRLEKE